MKIKHFEDIIAWQKSEQLTLKIYDLFKNNRDYKFKDQMQSASISIMSNIAEGFERQNNKEFSRFLYIARGSCGEVRSLCYIAYKLKYISENDSKEIHSVCVEISKMLFGLVQVLNK